MNKKLTKLALAAALVLGGSPALAEQYVVKLENPLGDISPGLQETLKISVIERFEAEGANFVVLDVVNDGYLETFVNAKNLRPLAISKVDFINSPVVGGGDASPQTASAEHQTFVIERPIPGVGSFPLEKKEGISRASNAAIERMNGSVEWVHSYLTDVGTYCIYRATDEGQIVEHAELAGAPLGPITAVERIPSE